MSDITLSWSHIETVEGVQKEDDLSLDIVLTEEGANYILENTKGWKKAFVKSYLESKQISFDNNLYGGPLEEIIQLAKKYNQQVVA
jgi:hypothetical protein